MFKLRYIYLFNRFQLIFC